MQVYSIIPPIYVSKIHYLYWNSTIKPIKCIIEKLIETNEQ